MQIISLNETKIKNEVEQMRPPLNIRPSLDIGYSFEKNSLEIFEVRPSWHDKSTLMRYSFAKAKFVKAQNIWKIYWKRASGKWELYEEEPEVKDVLDFFKIVKDDKLNVFMG